MQSFVSFFIRFAFLVFPWVAMAQQPMEDVLYLKNGWILRGTITSVPTDSLVSLRTRDENLFTFNRMEINRMQQEPMADGQRRSVQYQRRGFRNYTEIGSIIAKTSAVGAALTLQIINGYHFNPWVFTGLGIGVDSYSNQSLLPLFVSFRGDLVHQGGFIPFYFVDGGYGYTLSGHTTANGLTTKARGGNMLAMGLGTKILVYHHAGVLLSVGYHYQQSSLEQEWVGGGGNKTVMTYRRAVVRMGFTF